MLRRFITLTLIAACIGLRGVSAQDAAWPAGPDRYTPWANNGMWAPNRGYPPASTPYGSALPDQYRPAPGYPPNAPGGLTTYQYLPNGDDRGPFYDDTPFHDFADSVLAQTWFRVDYLNYSLTGPGEALLGAPIRGLNVTDDPLTATNPLQATSRDGFPRVDLGTGFPIFAQATRLNALDLDHRNGIRGTIGIPTANGGIEANVWTLQQAEETFNVQPNTQFSFLTTIPAITLLINGQKSDISNFFSTTSMILFDDGMAVSLQTELMGAEIDYVCNPLFDGSPIRIQPLAGVRYIRMHETLSIAGRDLADAINPQINSESLNDIIGPQLGMRLEWGEKRIRIGTESKLALSINRHEDRVRTAQLFRNPDPANNVVSPPRQTAEGHTDFAPIYQLQVYAQVQLSHRVKVRAGYDFLTMFEVSRPYNNIYWNDTGISGDPTQIVVRARDRETFIAQGLFVSGEISLY